jgi:hypothetical protein
MNKPLRYMVPNHENKSKQKGGAASNFSGLWHSPTADPAELSRFSIKYIDYSPMFNPFQRDTILATPTSGIIPTGIYLANKCKSTIPKKGFVRGANYEHNGKTQQ